MNARELLSGARGIVRAECAGGFFERFLSEALNMGIEPFNVRFEGGAASFCVDARRYSRLRPLARSCQCRMRVIEKRGLPFALRKIKNALPLAVGLVVMLAAVWTLGELVVSVDIKGTSTIPRAEITASLERCGLKVGMWRSQVDVSRAEQLVLLDNERLSWAAINLSYGRATVELRDRLEGEYNPAVQPGGAIVAKRDAQIISVTLTSGEALVKAGETVSALERLVIPTKLAAQGSWAAGVAASVRGRTYYSERFESDYHEVFRERTGRSERARALSLGGLRLPLGARGCSYRWFDTLEYSEPIALFGFELPLRVETTEYFEINQRSERLTASRAEKLLHERRAEFERTALAGADILYKSASFSEAERGWALETEYICEEEIGEYFCP